jgi:hypothetical protein
MIAAHKASKEFEVFKSDNQFANLSLIDKIEKLKANC